MTTTATQDTAGTRRRPPVASRRVGYLFAVAFHLATLYIVFGRPGWSQLPILTDETPQVLDLLKFSLLLGVVVNLLYVVTDPRWLRVLGDLVTTAVGLAVLVRIWQVFPFDFADSPDWAMVARVVLVVAGVAASIALVAQLVRLVRAAA